MFSINLRAIVISAMAVTLCASARGQTSPPDLKLPSGAVTRVAVEYTNDGPLHFAGSNWNIPKQTYHYDVYLPEGYDDNPKSSYPCIFMASAGGNAAMGAWEKRINRDKWIAIMLVESQNGDWGPIMGNFISAHDDAMKRLRICDGLKFATGFSGAARASSMFCELRPGFAGLILQDAGLWYDYALTVRPYAGIKTNPLLGIYMLMGNNDPNIFEVAKVRQQIPPQSPFRYEVFEGKHQESSEEGMNRALDYVQEVIYVRAPAQPQLKAAYIQRILVMLDQAAEADHPRMAFERYELLDNIIKMATARSVASSLQLKAPLAKAQADLKELAKDPANKTELEARAAFEKISDTEQTARLQIGTTPAKQVKAWSSQAATAYTDLATKYPGTVYGQRATQLAALRNAEAVNIAP